MAAAEEIAAALNTFEGVTTTRNGSVIEVTAQGKMCIRDRLMILGLQRKGDQIDE